MQIPDGTQRGLSVKWMQVSLPLQYNFKHTLTQGRPSLVPHNIPRSVNVSPFLWNHKATLAAFEWIILSIEMVTTCPLLTSTRLFSYTQKKVKEENWCWRQRIWGCRRLSTPLLSETKTYLSFLPNEILKNIKCVIILKPQETRFCKVTIIKGRRIQQQNGSSRQTAKWQNLFYGREMVMCKLTLFNPNTVQQLSFGPPLCLTHLEGPICVKRCSLCWRINKSAQKSCLTITCGLIQTYPLYLKAWTYA